MKKALGLILALGITFNGNVAQAIGAASHSPGFV